MKKTALITGISGQDGTYLAQHLIENNYRVVGTSRDAQNVSFQNLKSLGIYSEIEFESVSLKDFASILGLIKKVNPDEIYHLAGQSSVGLSFEQPVETFESIATGTIYLLEAIRFLNLNVKLYNACSSECFGNTLGVRVNESTPFNPQSPYAIAKSAAYWSVSNYRDSYGIFACSGILFNHESPLRPERFVTQKIIKSALDIKNKKKQKLVLGNVHIRRDWGWAPEYVKVMHLMLQKDKPEDYVVATGETHSLEEFVRVAFEFLDLNYKNYLEIDKKLYRPTDIIENAADPAKALKKLGWKAQYSFNDVIQNMILSSKKP